MTIDGRELAQNITYCEGEGGHMFWGQNKRYSFESIKDSVPMVQMLYPDNPSFDVMDQTIAFINERRN